MKSQQKKYILTVFNRKDNMMFNEKEFSIAPSHM